MATEKTREDGGLEETRLIALGSTALLEGFALIGFETHADATPDILEAVLKDLVRTQEKALIVLEQALARSGTALLTQVRAEGGRIVVVEIPSLQAPEDHQAAVDDLVRRVLGPSVLEEGP
ncbi:hypothetical protein EVC37_15705 [Methylocaldum sp. BRCS4]|jgi:vacuolar-type H+-ATPase subunit F/Vma7|uniref:V-type ATP synthase subunit F n=1 Tax=Methylocaldum sp. 14B TaxID=1912213 RepID=UPI00098B3D32|nr:V-type ATP synthase subunit F [Methylocaldum sp. 14B]MVF23049.1 hypothetical protein [Methylocaldum sp. BRCS4]